MLNSYRLKGKGWWKVIAALKARNEKRLAFKLEQILLFQEMSKDE